MQLVQEKKHPMSILRYSEADITLIENTIKHSVARGREGKPQLTPQVINVPKIVPNTIMRKYFCSFTGTYY